MEIKIQSGRYVVVQKRTNEKGQPVESVVKVFMTKVAADNWLNASQKTERDEPLPVEEKKKKSKKPDDLEI